MKKDLIVTHRDDLDTDCEIIWTQCQIKNRRSKSLFFASFYRPNVNDLNSLNELDASLFKLGDKINTNNVILAGDFNAPNINWNDLNIPNGPTMSERLLDVACEHGFTQLVQEPTRKQGETENILDLVLTNNDKIISNVQILPGISDHDMVFFYVNLACSKKRRIKCKIYMRKKADTTRIQEELQDLVNTFNERMIHESVEAKWNMFQEKITEIMDTCIPHKFTSTRHNLPWFGRTLRRQTRKKQKLYNKAKKSGKQSDWCAFKAARKQLHRNLKLSRDNYFSDFLGNSIQENPKAFWSHIKHLGNEDAEIRDFKIDDEVISDPLSKAEALNNQFASVFSTEETNGIPDVRGNPIPPLGEIIISTIGVEKQLRMLKPNKAYSPDAIPPWFLKENTHEISKILSNIYQHSINTGTIPSMWKEANVCAIHKKGKKSDPANYRPISLTCVASKVLEHIVHSQVMKHLAKHEVLTDYQHGFRAKRSTETQLICTIHDIANTIQANKTVHAAILDFSKAFDKVPHRRLLKKLSHYGIHGPLLDWFESFLNKTYTISDL